MEPQNQNILSVPTVESAPQAALTPALPTWVKVTFRIYGLIMIIFGILSLLFPLFAAFIAVAMGGGQESFGLIFKAYAFMAGSALPLFILAYGFIRLRKWVLSCLIIQIAVFVLAPFYIFISDSASFSRIIEEFKSVEILWSFVFSILILALVIRYKEGLSEKYLSLTPVILMVLSLLCVQFLATQTLQMFEIEAPEPGTQEVPRLP